MTERSLQSRLLEKHKKEVVSPRRGRGACFETSFAPLSSLHHRPGWRWAALHSWCEAAPAIGCICVTCLRMEGGSRQCWLQGMGHSLSLVPWGPGLGHLHDFFTMGPTSSFCFESHGFCPPPCPSVFPTNTKAQHGRPQTPFLYDMKSLCLLLKIRRCYVRVHYCVYMSGFFFFFFSFFTFQAFSYWYILDVHIWGYM